MNNLMKQLKQAWDALDYDHLSDQIGYIAKYNAMLLEQPTDTVSSATSVVRKQIALGVGETLPAPVMDYVIEACQRMQADLLLITSDSRRVRAQLADYLPALQNIRCQAEELTTVSPSAVRRVLQNRSNILFAVSGTPDNPVHCLLKETAPPVPIVTLNEATPEEKPLPTETSHTKKEAITVTLLLGIVSVILYVMLLTNSDLFIEWARRTQQGEKMLFLIPIVVAFVFSYVHGAFTGHFWESVGLRAAVNKTSPAAR